MAELNERLQLQVNFDGSGWEDFAEVPNLFAGLRKVMRLRADGSSGDLCMAGYRLLDGKRRAVFVLAPICCRITDARVSSTGESPATSTV